MGMYTRICLSVKLDKDSDRTFKKWCEENTEDINPSAFNNHPFFKKERVWAIFSKCDSYFSREMTPVNEIKFCDYQKSYYLKIDTCLKNYGGEIESFFDFIKTMTTDKVLGFSEYEESPHRTYYLNDN